MFSSEYVSYDYLHLNSCGIEYLNKIDTHTKRLKGRKDYHILYIHKGRCILNIENKDEVIKSGGVILLRPGQKHDYIFKKDDNSISCYLHFTGTKCDYYMNKMGMKDKSYIYIKESDTVKNLFEKLSEEYTLKRNFYEDLSVAYMIEIFSEIGRRYEKLNNYLSEKEELINRVCLLMNENYNKNYSIKYYSDFCNLSESRFFHIFKEIKNISPNNYIIKIKVEKAKDYLLNTDFTICQIADITGFYDCNYFSRMFKKYVGISPGAFLQEKV